MGERLEKLVLKYKLAQEKKNVKDKLKKEKEQQYNLKLQEKNFKKKARKIFGYEYDYSKVLLKNNRDGVVVVCRKHGDFLISPKAHLSGKGCPKCNKKSRGGNKEEFSNFIQKAKEKYGDRYDYSKVKDIGNNEKICVICKEHGEFWVSPKEHLINAKCPHCVINNDKVINTKSFIEKAKKVHGDKYDYSKSKYIDSKTPVCIICPIHGEFWQKPSKHLAGGICQKCCTTYKLNTETFIEKANKIHENRYDYSKTEYKGANQKVCIICPEHGEFWQRAGNHLAGSGCPTCVQSKYENEVREMLIENNIEFIPQKTFDWLKHFKNLYLDFYLPKYNIAIECQGGFHYKCMEHFGGVNKLKKIKDRDNKKNKLCDEHNIKLIYYGDENYGNGIIVNINDLLSEIYNYN